MLSASLAMTCARHSTVISAAGASSSLWPTHPNCNLFCPTRVRHKPQTMKTNPHQTTPGKFDQSFERIVGNLESRLPFRERNFGGQSIHEQLYGEESREAALKAAREDVEGREPERPAARLARSYFSDEDLSPEALGVRSPSLKVAQHISRQNYDKRILRTSTEAPCFYYRVQSDRERMLRRVVRGLVFGGLAVSVVSGWNRLRAYMLSDI